METVTIIEALYWIYFGFFAVVVVAVWGIVHRASKDNYQPDDRKQPWEH